MPPGKSTVVTGTVKSGACYFLSYLLAYYTVHICLPATLRNPKVRNPNNFVSHSTREASCQADSIRKVVLFLEPTSQFQHASQSNKGRGELARERAARGSGHSSSLAAVVGTSTVRVGLKNTHTRTHTHTPKRTRVPPLVAVIGNKQRQAICPNSTHLQYRQESLLAIHLPFPALFPMSCLSLSFSVS